MRILELCDTDAVLYRLPAIKPTRSWLAIKPISSSSNKLIVGLVAQLVESTARVSQRSWIRISFMPDFFFPALILQLVKLSILL